MKFCPQCGKGLTPGNRFCDECGYDTSPVNLVQAEPPFTQPVTPSTLGVNAEEPAAAVPLHVEATIPDQMPPPAEAPRPIPPIPPDRAYPGFANTKKGSNKLVWILIGIIGVAALVTGGWFGYSKFIKGQPTETIVADSSIMIDESTSSDTGKTTNTTQAIQDSLKTAQAIVAVPENKTASEAKKENQVAKPPTKNKSATKTTAKQQNQANQTSKPEPKPQAKQGSVITVKQSDFSPEKTLTTLFSSNSRETPKYKNPKNPTRFTVGKPSMIMRVITDHFNEDKGTTNVGSVTIMDKDKKVIGTYKARGKNGSNGTTNGKWVAEPHISLEKGTYYIMDSDPSTWSKNFFGTGFVEVEGYEL